MCILTKCRLIDCTAIKQGKKNLHTPLRIVQILLT